MKRINELNPEDAKILLQSQPLSSALWLASTDKSEDVSYRLPDPAFADSKNWPSYIKTKKESSTKSITSVDYIKVPETPAIKEEHTIPDQVEQVHRVIIENKPIKTETITEPAEPKPKRQNQVILHIQQQESKRKREETYTESLEIAQNQVVENSTGLVSKRNAKNLDFYQWLEELQAGPKTAKRQKPPLESKLPLKTEATKGSETLKIIESSLTLKEEVISETLAKLLARQGHKQEAISMYEKLMLKFPEKGSTFATAIEKLKT